MAVFSVNSKMLLLNCKLHSPKSCNSCHCNGTSPVTVSRVEKKKRLQKEKPPTKFIGWKGLQKGETPTQFTGKSGKNINCSEYHLFLCELRSIFVLDGNPWASL